VPAESVVRRNPWVAASVAAAAADGLADAQVGDVVVVGGGAGAASEASAAEATARAESLRAALRAARAAKSSVAPRPSLAVLYRRIASVPLRLAPADEGPLLISFVCFRRYFFVLFCSSSFFLSPFC
jgi:hypothetical protein